MSFLCDIRHVEGESPGKTEGQEIPENTLGGNRLAHGLHIRAALTGRFAGKNAIGLGQGAKQRQFPEHIQKLFVNAMPPSVVEPELAFGKMEGEKLFLHAAELDKAALGISPEALYPVDMAFAVGELIRAVVDLVMPVTHSGKTAV